ASLSPALAAAASDRPRAAGRSAARGRRAGRRQRGAASKRRRRALGQRRSATALSLLLRAAAVPHRLALGRDRLGRAQPHPARRPAAPSRPLEQVLALVKTLQAELPIDADRVYLVGLSMGGYGVWDLLCRAPSLFAAAVAICGGGDEAQAERLRGLPIWAFHG